MQGKIVLITGGTSGVGKAVATELARRGASVTLVGRELPRGEEAVQDIVRVTGNRSVDFVPADLSLQKDVRRVASEFLKTHGRLDVLINNAGVLLPHREVTLEGVEKTRAVNTVAPFLLTTLLLDTLKASAPSRVILTASAAQSMGKIDLDDPGMEKRYRGFAMYSRTKLEVVLLTYALARRLQGSGVTANCFHPGVVKTGLFRHGGVAGFFFGLARPFMITPQKASATPVYLASSGEVRDVTGKYFVKCVEKKSARPSYDLVLQDKLWEGLERLCAGAP